MNSTKLEDLARPITGYARVARYSNRNWELSLLPGSCFGSLSLRGTPENLLARVRLMLEAKEKI